MIFTASDRIDRVAQGRVLGIDRHETFDEVTVIAVVVELWRANRNVAGDRHFFAERVDHAAKEVDRTVVVIGALFPAAGDAAGDRQLVADGIGTQYAGMGEGDPEAKVITM